MKNPRVDITPNDLMLLNSGNHYHMHRFMGSHFVKKEDKSECFFKTWAPNAINVSIVGDFNDWDPDANPMLKRQDQSGIWEGHVRNIAKGAIYKYAIKTAQGFLVNKGDPFAWHWETPPANGSRVWDLDFEWNDRDWMHKRKHINNLKAPISVYEVHLGSWKKPGNKEELDFYNYKDLAHDLAQYVKNLGYTHIELMPVMEHPYYPSWGYQIHGYFAPSSRFGTPQDFMYFVNHMHQNGIGVFLDWVPSHFPGDAHGLYRYDGTALFEHNDPRLGYHPDWKSYIFNYGRYEVKSFLISNAIFWLEKYHVDGIRVDAVASMLHLNYSRKDGEWIPNKYGGNENIEAIAFLRALNTAVYDEFPDVQMIAEESTTFPKVSRPIEEGGLGFGMKWMMGWMNDSIEYMKCDPLFRKDQHSKITFSIVYAFSENFMLPFSHDEVVHGKASMLMKMPGKFDEKFDHLATLYAYMYGHPGAKLLFMGSEFGQSYEWRFAEELPWNLLSFEPHQKLLKLISSLNTLYRNEPALYEKQFSSDGFEWVRSSDWQRSIIIFKRIGNLAKESLFVVCNFTPVTMSNFEFGVDKKGKYDLIFNSNDPQYYLNKVYHTYTTKNKECDGFHSKLLIDLPGLSVQFFKIKQGKSVKISNITTGKKQN